MDEKKLPKQPTVFFRDLFDVFAWWRNVGFAHFPDLYLGAMLLLAKPSHNGFQERVFSLGNYKDSRLMKRKHADNFEMGVLEHVNLSLIERHQNYMQLQQPNTATTDPKIEPKTMIENFFSKKINVPNICENFYTQDVDDYEPENDIDLDDPVVIDEDEGGIIKALKAMEPGLNWSEEFEDFPDDESLKDKKEKETENAPAPLPGVQDNKPNANVKGKKKDIVSVEN